MARQSTATTCHACSHSRLQTDTEADMATSPEADDSADALVVQDDNAADAAASAAADAAGYKVRGDGGFDDGATPGRIYYPYKN